MLRNIDKLLKKRIFLFYNDIRVELKVYLEYDNDMFYLKIM